MTARRSTATSNFGVGRREGHDASAFYARFTPPLLSDDATVAVAPDLGDGCILGDARRMADLPDNSVALVVTSPPYFAGKQYEEELEREGVPSSYAEYLALLTAVFDECVRVLEPGGRIAVNVANLGRKPYRSLSADVIAILEGLGLLLRGEVIWKKADGASGNCAWGSFRKPGNPVLRDITERVVIASKGRFDRAVAPAERARRGLPHEATMTSDEFMENTLDVWEIPAESAQRVGHPAPFPVELPERLIRLYTYKGDLVLDPFLGSGSTLVAAAKTGRRGVGYDTDEDYVRIARKRVLAARPPAVSLGKAGARTRRKIEAPPPVDADVAFQARATREGKAAKAIAEQVLDEAKFTGLRRDVKPGRLGIVVNYEARDLHGDVWYFDVTGAFTTARGGLARTDTVFKCLGRANVLLRNKPRARLVFLTSHLPKPGSDGDRALRAAGRGAFFDAVEMLSDAGRGRLETYALGGVEQPLPGFWTEADLRSDD
jgi:site-specific DNA-methyltransferase (adenine-specific)